MGPFDLSDASAYSAWRAAKLAEAPRGESDLLVEIADPARPSRAEVAALSDRLRRANMAIYKSPPRDEAASRDAVRGLAGIFGLERFDPNMLADDDGISSLSVARQEGMRTRYIPYTDRPIAWHADGYYNLPEKSVRAMLLHCVRPAKAGGENELMDHEMLYIALRDEDPALIAALMRPTAMTIPENREEGMDVRPERTGPVFSLDAAGKLHIRYTARTRSIRWEEHEGVARAVRAIEEILARPSPHVFRCRLAAGEGLICNNVLHNRARFEDDPAAPRLLLRLRAYDRLKGT